MIELKREFDVELGNSLFKVENKVIMELNNNYNDLDDKTKISFAMFVLDVFKQEIEAINGKQGFPAVKVTEKEISDDMKSVGLIVNRLCDILTERFGFDVHKELEKRIDETEIVD